MRKLFMLATLLALGLLIGTMASPLVARQSPEGTQKQQPPEGTLKQQPPDGTMKQQPQDKEYTGKIIEATSEKFFLTELVDHLPASEKVPTPLNVLGHIVGAPDILDYSQDIHRYMRSLAQASPRVKVFSIGPTDQGKEMIAVAVSSEANIARLDRIREIMARLADPRGQKENEAGKLLAEGLPIYWLTGGLHSQETGSPEMMMELAYRLAIGESDVISAIRQNMVVLMTPILEVDGWDRMVDVYRYKKANPGKSIHMAYWGDYVYHDNNRDSIGLGLKLTRNLLRTYFAWHPIVMHDLHESIPYLYISSGTGPYNAWLDPITVNEWEEMAQNEVAELTRRGVPGVWTHGFFDGWAPSYSEYIASAHNSLGRFYETFGGSGADTDVRTSGGPAKRDWFRPNPPFEAVRWSFRNNINLQQSGVLLALQHVAEKPQKYLLQFYLKSKRSVSKPENEGPAAYVIPADTSRPLAAAGLVNLLRQQGVEVHQAEKEIALGKEKYPAGSYVVRMDQPYSRCADMLLDTQYYNPRDPNPYDDTGWSLGPLFNVRTVRVTDTAILKESMKLVRQDARPAGKIDGEAKAVAYLIPYHAENELAIFRYQVRDVAMRAVEAGFMDGERRFPAGSVVIPLKGMADKTKKQLEKAAEELGLDLVGTTSPPEVKTHELLAPRIGLLHSWVNTQNEGWFRIALEKLRIPFTYLSLQQVRDEPRLRAKYDAIIFPPSGGQYGKIQRIVNGIGGDAPIPWQKSDKTPNLGSPASSPDIRGGLELSGILHLKQFVQEGGLLITVTDTVALPIEYGLVESVAVLPARKLKAIGSILNVTVSDSLSPLAYGYERNKDLAVYFNRGPILEAGQGAVFSELDPEEILYGPSRGRPSGRGSLKDPDVAQGRPQKKEPISGAGTGISLETKELLNTYLPQDIKDLRIILRFTGSDKMLVSGMLEGADELAGRPAVVDAKVGAGHVVMFAINPMWRVQTIGSYPLLLNSLMHYKSLDAGRVIPAEKSKGKIQ